MTRPALLLLVFSLGLFLVLELSTRLSYFGWAGLSYARINSVRPIGWTDFLQPSSHPGVLYELRPNLDEYFKLAKLQTNTRGFRDQEYARDKSANSFRVAVIGSSATMASGVEIEDAYHSRVEAQLNRSQAPLHYEWINYAVGGYFPDQQLATLRHRALTDRPDLILFAVTARNLPYMFETPGTRVREFRPRPIRRPFFESFFLIHRLKVVDKPRGTPTPVEMQEISGPDIFGQLQEIHHELAVPIVLLYLEYRDLPQAPDVLRGAKAAEDSGLHWVDTTTAFAGTDGKDFRIYAIDPHPNAQAHERFAEVLSEYLKTRQLLG